MNIKLKQRAFLVVAPALMVLAALLIFPEALFSPGEINRKHKEIKNCFTCHIPFVKPDSGTCGTGGCHTPEKWKEKKAASRSHITDEACTKCHTEHQGARRLITVVPAHTTDIDIKSDCTKCHVIGKSHLPVKKEACELCHSLDAWRPVPKFDHKALKGKGKCADCHKPSKFHFTTKKECETCHTSKRWSPSSMRHRFPVQHRSRKGKRKCDTCHPVSLAAYDCYTGCHKHKPKKVKRKHVKHKIKDFADCVKCHPTGREKEGKYRKKRRKKR